jgi:hypothetical protein
VFEPWATICRPQSWLRLAAEIESGQKLLDLIGDISRDLVPIAEAAE